MNLQNILHINNTRHLAKECHQVSKLYKCTKCNSNDRSQHSGTKYYSSNCYTGSHFADMRRYESMSCFSNTPSLRLTIKADITHLNHCKLCRLITLMNSFTNVINVKNICPFSIQGTAMM